MNRTIIINHETEKVDWWIHQTYYWLLPLSKMYPSFTKWYHNQVIPGVKLGHWFIVIEMIDNQFGAIAILKNVGEKKLCTLRVGRKYQRKGIGSKLMEKCLVILEQINPCFL